MSSEIVIKVEGLSKCYQIYDTPRDRLKQFLVQPVQRILGLPKSYYCRDFWALKDVSFEVKRGETVGIIGRNGSGKSTLLQLICGTLGPTTGTVVTVGRIAALLELGSGFNPEFSGRDNVYMSCALLGLSNEEIDKRFDEIAAFADIGDFINQPVKTYSSGMFVRLAFAVNVISQPDVMVVDEALAVGDIGFQAKCMTALSRFRENGGTVLFVSHDVGTVKSLCRQAVYLERGKVVCIGTAAKVADIYERSIREEMSVGVSGDSASPLGAPEQREAVLERAAEDSRDSSFSPANLRSLKPLVFKTSEQFDGTVASFRYGTGAARVRYAELVDESDNPILHAEYNQNVLIRIYFEVEKEVRISVNYYIQDDKKNLIIGAGNRNVGRPLLRCEPGKRYIASYATRLPLQEGRYSMQVQLTTPIVVNETASFLDVVDDAVVFTVARGADVRLWTKVYIDNHFSLLEAPFE